MNGTVVRAVKTGVEYPSRSAAAHALWAAFGLKQDMNRYEIVRLAFLPTWLRERPLDAFDIV